GGTNCPARRRAPGARRAEPGARPERGESRRPPATMARRRSRRSVQSMSAKSPHPRPHRRRPTQSNRRNRRSDTQGFTLPVQQSHDSRRASRAARGRLHPAPSLAHTKAGEVDLHIRVWRAVPGAAVATGLTFGGGEASAQYSPPGPAYPPAAVGPRMAPPMPVDAGDEPDYAPPPPPYYGP